jgi:hypothetical protein
MTTTHQKENMMRANAWKLLGLLTVGAMIGCGPGSGGSSGGGFSTSAPSATAVQNLTPSQASQLCTDLTNYLNQQVDSQSYCQTAAVIGIAQAAQQQPSLTDAELQAACEATVAQYCPTASPDGGAASCGSTAGCSATVEQISACANDEAAYLKQFEAMFPTCATITRAKLASVNPDASPDMEPASCKPLDTSCPNWGPMTMMSGG